MCCWPFYLQRGKGALERSVGPIGIGTIDCGATNNHDLTRTSTRAVIVQASNDYGGRTTAANDNAEASQYEACTVRAAPSVLVLFLGPRYGHDMTDAPDYLTPATPEDVALALEFALLHRGRKRMRHASELMAGIVAERLVEHLEQSGFVIMKKPPQIGGAAALGRGFQGR